MAITKASNRLYTITPADHGNILELGPGSTTAFSGMLVVQFNPDINFSGEIKVLARLSGAAAESANLPFLPVPYRTVTANNVAQDYSFTWASIAGPSKIQIPASGDSIGFLVACTAGSCTYVCRDMNGAAV